MAIGHTRNWRITLAALASVGLLCLGGYALAGGSDGNSAREEFDAAWAQANAASIANVQLAQASTENVEMTPDRPRGSTTMPAGATDGSEAVPIEPGGEAPGLPPQAVQPESDATRRFRERVEANRRASMRRPRGTAPLTPADAQPNPAEAQPAPMEMPPADTQPADMRSDSHALPDVSDEELKRLREKIRSGSEETAVPAEPETPVQPEVAEPTPAEAEAQPAPEPRHPSGRPIRPGSRGPSPAAPGAPPPAEAEAQPAPEPGQPTPPAGNAQPAPAHPGPTTRPTITRPRGTAPQQVTPPVQPNGPATGTPTVPPRGEHYEVRVNEQTKQPELVRPKEYFRIPFDERKFFYVWKNTPLQKTFEDVADMSGLSPLGQIEGGEAQLPITFESTQMQNFDDALTTYNQIIMEKGYWVLRMDQFIGVRRLTDWYRYLPPNRIYDTVDDYKKAKLPEWDLASVRYEPKFMSPGMLAQLLMDNVPDNTARATVVPDSNKVELKGFVTFINKQLEFATIYDKLETDGREWRTYPLKYCAPSVAADMLAELMPPTSTPTPTARPTPTPVRGRGTAPVPMPQPSTENLASTADEVEIREHRRQNQLLVRATPAKHKLIEEYIRDFIEVPLEVQERREVIQLQYADPNDLVEKITPLLGRRELYQPPTPPPRPGPGGQQVEQPTPPPQFRTVGSTAVLVPLENSRSILVKATEDEMAQIKEYVKMLDIDDPDQAKYQLVNLEHGSASNIASVLSTVFMQRGSYRPGSRQTSEGLRAVADSTDKAIILTSENKRDMDDAKILISQMDVDPNAGAVEHVVILENATPSALAETLSSRFSQSSGGGGGYYYGRGRSYGGGSSDQLPRFLPDDTSKMLIVLSREDMWPDIDRLIKQVDDQSKVATLTKTYRMKHIDASMMTSILSDSLSGRGGGRRGGWYGAPSDPNAPMFAYEPQSNSVIVTALDEIHAKAKELMDQIDVPGPADQATWRSIQLAKADAEYVEGVLEDVFERGSSGRRRGGYSGYGFGYGSESSGGAGKAPIRIIAEAVSNRILVSSSEEDFVKIEEMAKQIDADYASKEMVRQTFELQFADPAEVSEIVQAAFEARSSRRSRGGWDGGWGGGMSSDGPNLGVKVAEIGRGIIIQAPKDKMEEIAGLIKEIDVDSTSGNVIKSYKVKGSDYRGTYELANSLRQLFTKDSGRGGGSSSSRIKFIGEYGSDLLLVSAPANRLDEIDKQVNELVQAKQGVDMTMVIRHFDVRQARPQEMADVIEPVLESKYQEMQQQSGGGRFYGGWGGSSGPRITAHKNENKIMVSAPGSLMPIVEELLTEFDRPSLPSTTRIITLMTAKADEIAPVVEEQINRQSGSSRRRSRSGYGDYGGWFSRWSSRNPSDGDSSDQLQVTAVESSNSIILTGAEQMVGDAQALIKQLDEGARPEGMFKVIKVTDADLLEVADTVEQVVGGGSSSDYGYSSGYGSSRRGSSGAGAVMVRTDYATNQLIVYAPPEKFPIIEQVVGQLEGLAREARTLAKDTGVTGEVIARDRTSVTKLYKVNGPAKEVAEVLDKALYELMGWDAPYVKPYTFTNEIIVEGEPKQFAQVEKILQEIEKNPPKPKITVLVRRVDDPQKAIEQLQRYAVGEDVNIRPIMRTGSLRSPLEVMQDKEVKWYDPIVQPGTVQPATESPFVPATGELAELKAAVAALAMGPVAGSQPATTAATTQPAAEKSAAQYLLEGFAKEGGATRPASTTAQAAAPTNAPATQPVAAKPAEAKPAAAIKPPTTQPVAAKPAEAPKAPAAAKPAEEPKPAVAAKPAEPAPEAKPATPVAKAPEAPAPAPKTTVAAPAPQQPKTQTVAQAPPAPEQRVSPDEEMFNQLNQAAGQAKDSQQLQVRYDPDQGLIFIVGQESQVKDFDYLLDTITKELEELDDATKAEFRVYRVEHIAVEVAASILETMFNDTVPAQQQQQQQQRGRGGRQGQQGNQPNQSNASRDNQQGQGDEEGGNRRREEEESRQQQEAQAKAAAAAAQRIKVIADPRTGTLIIRAAAETFPAIAELLLKIDRPGSGAGVIIRLFQLERLNAGEVEEAIKSILKIDDGRTRTLRGRTGLSGLRGRGGGETDLIERLQEEMLEMQMQQQQAAVEAANAAQQAQQQGTNGAAAAAGKLRLNPSKDIGITSDATTNTIIVSAPQEGIDLVASLIDQLEKQEIPLEIKTFKVENADAENVATGLQTVFAADRGGGGGRRGGLDGISPGRVGGDIRITANSRAGTVIVRALKPDMAKIEPLIRELDVPPQEQQVQIYPVNAGNATEMAATLAKIFADPADTGSRAVRIQADAETNSLLVYAPTEAKQLLIASKIKELDEKVVESTEPQRIELKFANATKVAQTLTSVFVPKSNRRTAQRIEVTGDDNSGVLFVRAPDEILKQIQRVAADLDKPANQEIRVIKLKNAVASDIETTFRALLTQLMVQLKGAGAASDVPAITPDPRTNSLVVVGSPAAFVVVEQALRLLDVPPDDSSAQTVALYPISAGRADTVAASINSLYAGQKFPGGVQPPRAIASGKDMIYVYGTGKQIQDIKAQIVDPAEAQIAPTLTAVKSFEFAVQHIKADEAAKQIQDWFKSRNTAMAAAGTTMATSETVVEVTANPLAKRLYVQCSDSNKKRIEELLAQIDTEEFSGAGLKYEVLPVKYTDVTYAYQAISALFAKSDRPVNERPIITYEYGSRSLVVKAMPEDLEKIKEVLARVDTDEQGKSLPPRTIVIDKVKASEVVTQLNTYITQTYRRDARTGLYPVTVGGNDSNNTIVINAQRQEDLDKILSLIQQLDSRPAGLDPREFRAYVVKYADLQSVIAAINGKFAANVSRPIKDQVFPQADYGTSSLLVTASPENHAEVAKIVAELDKMNIGDTMPKPVAIPVKNVRATLLAAQLNQMIPTMYKIDRRTGRYPVSVAGDDASNTLLVTARAEEMEQMKKVIGDLDIRTSRIDDRQTQSYVVQYADLTAVYTTIQSRFPANPTKTERDQVTVGLDYANSTVIVTANEDNQKTVGELIKGLDRLDNVGRKVTKTITVEKARATDLATTLTATIRAAAPQRRTPAPAVQANDATNTLLVTASEKEFADIEALVKILDVEPDADSERTLKVYPIKYAEVYSVTNAINQSFRGVGATKKVADTVEAVVEAGTYSTIVMANAENHEKVAKFIEDLDKPGTGTRQTFTLEIQYADPEDVVQTLTNIYNNAMERTRRDSRVPAVFNVMQGTRKLLVTTTPSDLEEIKALIAEIDVQESIKSRDLRVVSVQRIAPDEMAKMLTEYLRKPGRSNRYDPNALLGDVRIVASAGAGAVVLTGPADRLDELQQLIERVDAAKADDLEKTGRQVAVIPLVNADPSSIVSVITTNFGKRGQVAEAELVEAAAERTTNTVVVTATPEKLEKVREMIKQLDENSSNTPKQQIVQLQHARAQDLVLVLSQTYSRSRRASGGPQIAFAADNNGNSIVVSAGEADLIAIKDMIEQLDKPATDQVQEMRVMPLEFIDATETEQILSEHFRKPTGTGFGGRRGGSSDLIGDIRIQSSAIMNALIVSGSSQDLDKIQEMIRGMDKDVAGATGAPRILKVENGSATLLAQSLTQMFTDPAKQSRGRTSPDTVPLIVADEMSGSLLVRARNVDYKLIEDMVKQLDVPTEGGRLKLIPVKRGRDMATLARTIQDTINQGELAMQQQQRNYRAGRVAVSFDERVPALIVAGTPELFKQVEEAVAGLENMTPQTGLSPRTIIVPLRGGSDPAKIKRIMDELIERQTGVKQK